MTNLLQPFEDRARLHPDKLAIKEAGKGTEISFSELASRSQFWADYWQRTHCLKPGQRVLIAMPLGIDLYVGLAALWRLKVTVVFPEPALGIRGLKTAIDITRPNAVLLSGHFRLLPWISGPVRRISKRLLPPKLNVLPPEFQDLPETRADHPALISFTTGSTGRPKAIVRSHGFLLAQCETLAPLIGSDDDSELDLVCFPVFVIANLALGVSSVLPPWKLKDQGGLNPAQVQSAIQELAITRMMVPPSICEHLISAESLEPGRLKTIFTGGGPVFPDLIKAVHSKLPKVDLVAVYGSTEAEPIAHLHTRTMSDKIWNGMLSGKGIFAGYPVPEIKLKIIDDEICVTGDHVNKTYLNGMGDRENKAIIDNQIWHRTGDAGHLDSAGNLWLLGRKKSRAKDLYPFQVEVPARQWPGVKAVALCEFEKSAILAISGNEPEAGLWQFLASKIGTIRVVSLAEIPMDQRHASKVDYSKLKQLVEQIG